MKPQNIKAVVQVCMSNLIEFSNQEKVSRIDIDKLKAQATMLSALSGIYRTELKRAELMNNPTIRLRELDATNFDNSI